MSYADRAKYAERGLTACRRSYHKYDSNMGKEKHISMETLTKICETLNCGILDVIELEQDEVSADEAER